MILTVSLASGNGPGFDRSGGRSEAEIPGLREVEMWKCGNVKEWKSGRVIE